MPRIYKPLSEEQKKKHSIAMTGSNNPFFGRHHTEESKEKSHLSHIGKKQSQETIEKRRLKNIGKKRPLEAIRKTSLANTGRIAPFEERKKISLARMGKKRSKESCKKQSETMKGKKRPPHSKEWNKKISEWHIAHPNKKFKDTKIELKIEEKLKKREIIYEKQVPLCKIANVDFYLPEYHIVIQCDGCYWHGCPIHFPNEKINQKEKDIRQDAVLTFNGFNVYRFWEHEINKSPEDCINTITFLKNKSLKTFLKEGKENNYYEQNEF